MKQMVVYEVVTSGDDRDVWFYGSRPEAITAARKSAKKGQERVETEVYCNYIRTDLRKRALHAALLNRSGYLEGRDLIAKFPDEGAPAAGDAASEKE